MARGHGSCAVGDRDAKLFARKEPNISEIWGLSHLLDVSDGDEADG